MPIQLAITQPINRDYRINRNFGQGSGEPLLGYRYAEHVLALFGSSVVSYWPLWELTSGSAQDISANGFTGTHTAVTLGSKGMGDGHGAASYDGSTSFTNVYSAALAAAFNPSALTLLGWVNFPSGVFTDGIIRHVISFAADASNFVRLRKSSTNNVFNFQHTAGGTANFVNPVAFSVDIWVHLAMTIDIAADQMNAYINAAQTGTTQTGLGVWSGSLASTLCCIGSVNTTPAQTVSGKLAHWYLLNRAATAAEMVEVYRRAF